MGPGAGGDGRAVEQTADRQIARPALINGICSGCQQHRHHGSVALLRSNHQRRPPIHLGLSTSPPAAQSVASTTAAWPPCAAAINAVQPSGRPPPVHGGRRCLKRRYHGGSAVPCSNHSARYAATATATNTGFENSHSLRAWLHDALAVPLRSAGELTATTTRYSCHLGSRETVRDKGGKGTARHPR